MNDSSSTATATSAAEMWLADPARLSLLISALQEGVILQDEHGAILACNPSAERILGLDADQMRGRTSLDPRWRTIHEDGSPFAGETHPAMLALRTGHGVRDVVMGVHKPSGELTWILINAQPLLDASARAIAVIVTFHDVTERKRIEDGRRALERRVLELQRLESLGVMAGGIAHDFNNLLTTIVGNTELLELALGQSSSQRKYTERILASAARAADLAHKMMVFAGSGSARPERTDLVEVVASTLRFLRKSLPADVRVETDFVAPSPRVVVDVPQITQAVAGLTINACEAQSERPAVVRVAVGVSRADRAYLASTYLAPDLPEGDYAWFEVEDRGCGMDEATRLRMFDPFFTTKFAGRGLGLATVLGVVRGHGGAIRVASEPGLGTTVRVLLPLAT